MNTSTLLLLSVAYSVLGGAVADWSRSNKRGAIGFHVPFVVFSLVYYGGLVAMAFVFAWWSPFAVIPLGLLAWIPIGFVVVFTGMSNGLCAIIGSTLLILTLTGVV